MKDNLGKIFYVPNHQYSKGELRIILRNAISLSDLAIDLWYKRKWLIACFLCITALEEIGKLLFIVLSRNVTGSEIRHILLKHPKKQLIAVFGLLNANTHAQRYLGHESIVELMRMAESEELFKIRNNCLYSMVQENKIISTNEMVRKRVTKEILGATLEAIAEAGDIAHGGSKRGAQIRQKLLRRSEHFIKSNYNNRPLPYKENSKEDQLTIFKKLIKHLSVAK
ncbi:MAG: AbiV family abortive infection protein [bacterium]